MQRREDGTPSGLPFGVEEREVVAKSLLPDPMPVPPHWDARYIERTSRGRGDAWLDSDKPKRPVNKARGALWASLGLVDDALIVDAQMREGDE